MNNNRGYERFTITKCCLLLIIVMMMFSACEPKVEVLQNTSDYSQLDAKTILSYKTPYVGDNSKVINGLSSLLYSEFRKTVALQTDSKPYGITVDYEITEPDISVEEIESNLYINAVLLYSLIDNVDELTFSFSGTITKDFNYERAKVQEHFEKDLRDYANSIEDFEQLILDIS